MAKIYTHKELIKFAEIIAKNKKLNLEYVITSSKNYFINKINKNGEEFILKILKNYSANNIKNFLNESTVCKYFSDNYSSKFLLPKNCFINKSSKPYYILYTYIPGKPMSWYYYFMPNKFNVKKIFSLNSFIQGQTDNFIKLTKNKIKLDKISFNKNLKWHDSLYSTAKKIYSPELLNKSRRLIIKNKKILNNTELKLAHGDFHGRNIITYKNKYGFIDWGDFQLNIPSFDLSYLWLCSWNKPILQNKLRKLFYKKYPNNNLFELTILLYFPKFASTLYDINRWLNKPSNKKDRDYINQKTAYQKSISITRKNIKEIIKYITK